jgi:dolichol-phosphate mannosyltransferase
MPHLHSRLEAQLAVLFRQCGVGRFIAPDRAVRACEYGIVGATGSVVNAAVFLASAGLVHYLLAGAIAFFAGVTWNFGLNHLITFNRPVGRISTQYMRYLGVTIGGFILYSLLLTVVIEWTSQPHLVAVVIAIVGSGVWNFLGSERYAFREWTDNI